MHLIQKKLTDSKVPIDKTESNTKHDVTKFGIVAEKN